MAEPHRRVLIVDDDDASAALTRELLAEDGRVEVVGHARNGREALTLVAELDPDVILMDLHMPVMDGVEAVRRLRAGGSAGRIIIVTGTDEAGEVAAARAAGADGYVPKPQEVRALLHAILGPDA